MLDKCRSNDYNEITENEQMFGGGEIMNFTSTLITLFEIAMVIFVVWSVFHEDRFIKFEDRIAARFRRRKLKVIQGGSKVQKSYYPEKYRA